MKERVAIFFCGLSLLLCFATIVSWARSTTDYESVALSNQVNSYNFSASNGAAYLIHTEYVYDSPEIERVWKDIANPTHSPDWTKMKVSWSHESGVLDSLNHTVLGFGVASTTSDYSRRIMVPGIHLHTTVLQVPHWAIVLLTGLAPGYWFYRRNQLRQARVTSGLCRKCGFEIGNVYHCCPQCGERAPLPDGFAVIETH
ncbi:MAG TPA: hypothetical protein VHS31_10610 [Tepidisphaeraceae bacterium]|jgi:hypothetical protein|nr:hypothetical protein [Tepidisphaeraceae bacterium]